MLETPKSAKTPSTARIPDSCATSAILENGACTSVTFAPKILSRSRASSSACASRSRLINRPEINLSAIAFECPPAPSVASMYVPSGLTRSHSSTSPSITGVCGSLCSRHSPLATRRFLIRSPSHPKPCRPHPCTDRFSTDPGHAYGSSHRDNRGRHIHPLRLSFAPTLVALLAAALFPAHPSPPPGRNSSSSSGIFSSLYSWLAALPACLQSPTKPASDKSAPSRLSCW